MNMVILSSPSFKKIWIFLMQMWSQTTSTKKHKKILMIFHKSMMIAILPNHSFNKTKDLKHKKDRISSSQKISLKFINSQMKFILNRLRTKPKRFSNSKDNKMLMIRRSPCAISSLPLVFSKKSLRRSRIANQKLQ
jgi:hypothetical protein